MKKTKIIATIGPNSSSDDVIKKLILEGVNVIRIDMSNEDISFSSKVIKKVRKIEKELNIPVGIMIDTEGPVIRIGNIKEGKSLLAEEHTIKIYRYPVLCNNTQIYLSNSDILDELMLDDNIIIGESKAKLKVVDIDNDYIVCEIVHGGYIYSNEIVHFEKVMNIPFVSEKDRNDILFAINNNVDFLALSFIRTEQDVLEVIDLLIENDNEHLEIISKIENASAIDNIEEIAKVSDGLMVARSDLGISMSIEKIPYYQKLILNTANKYGKVSIVATDLLLSMENNEGPTLGEVADVYNAIMTKCDAVLLGGETTIGLYPVEAVQTISKIIESAEEDFDYENSLKDILRDTKPNITSSIAYSVVDSSIRLNSPFIIANTNSGYTARLISKFRPKSLILGYSPNNSAVHSLTIVYGVIPCLTDECKTTDSIVKMCLLETKKRYNLEKGNVVIITGGFPISNKNTNFMKIEVID